MRGQQAEQARRTLGSSWLCAALAVSALLACPSRADAVIKGYHDTSTCTATVGWTCDSENYSRAVTVHILDGPAGTGNLIGFPTASLVREAAVGSACGGYTAHGFSFATPSWLKDGRSRTLYTYGIDRLGNYTLLTLSPRSLTCASTGTNNAGFISQSVPTTLAPGESRNVSVTMKNTGTTTWTSAAGYKLASQNSALNTTWSLSRVLLGTSSIGPGAQKAFTFAIRAPSTPGTYNFQWRMLHESTTLQWFGSSSTNVAIVVKAPLPAQPTMISPTNGTRLASTTTVVRLDWGDVSAAATYALRATETRESDGALTANQVAGNTCNVHYLCRDGLPRTSSYFNMPVRPGHRYTWWVHAVNSSGWSGYTYVTFSVQAPTTVADLSSLANAGVSYDRFNAADTGRVTRSGPWTVVNQTLGGYNLVGLTTTTGYTSVLQFDVKGKFIHINVNTGPTSGRLAFHIDGSPTELYVDLYSKREEIGATRVLARDLAPGAYHHVALKAIPNPGGSRVRINRIAGFDDLSQAKCLDRGIPPVGSYCAEVYGNPHFMHSFVTNKVDFNYGVSGPAVFGGNPPDIYYLILTGDFEFTGSTAFSATVNDGIVMLNQRPDGQFATPFIMDFPGNWVDRDTAQTRTATPWLNGIQRILIGYYHKKYKSDGVTVDGSGGVLRVTGPPVSTAASYAVRGGYRFRTDNGAPDCTLKNIFTDGCSCPSGTSPYTYAKPRGNGQKVNYITYKDYLDLSNYGLMAPGTLGVIKFFVLKLIEFADVDNKPGSPGIAYACAGSSSNRNEAYQGAYMVRADGVGTQPNTLTTGGYYCPPGSITDKVAQALDTDGNMNAIYACRKRNAPLAGANKSSYGGMFHQRMETGACTVGNPIGDFSKVSTTILVNVGGSVVYPPYPPGYVPVSVPITDGQGDPCSCQSGYVPIPVAGISGGSPGMLFMCYSGPLPSGFSPLPADWFIADMF